MADVDAAVAIVHAVGAADSVLLMRRAERESDPWSGHWSFPGGRREPGDGALEQTALRELAEECGVHLTSAQLAKVLPPAVARRRVGRYLLVAPFLFQVDEELPTVLDPQEAASALWVPLKFLRDPARHSLLRIPGFAPEVRFAAIDLDGVPLWGFTYRLIADWLDLNPRGMPIGRAGFRAAGRLLDALIEHGCALARGWEARDGITVAAVKGAIPIEFVLAAAVQPADHIPWINMLEVHADRVRMVGLGFEEYLIEAV